MITVIQGTETPWLGWLLDGDAGFQSPHSRHVLFVRPADSPAFGWFYEAEDLD